MAYYNDSKVSENQTGMERTYNIPFLSHSTIDLYREQQKTRIDFICVYTNFTQKYKNIFTDTP